MELLLSALLYIFGLGIGEDARPVTFEQLVAAAIQFHEQRQVVPEIVDPETGKLNAAGKIDPDPDAPKIKGIYMTGPTAGISRFDKLIQLIQDTELNAVVIDVKEDHGYMTFEPADPELKAIGNYKKWIRDIHHVMNTLKENDIYPIARIVVFKDTVLANQRPDLSFLRPDGTVWHNGKANPESFVNPYMKEVWDYNIKVAKEAVALGFREIQFDYVRFPEGFETRADSLIYAQDERSRVDVVADFVKYAREELNPLDVRVSVDIFGYAASVPAAEGIGQDFNKISTYVDVISPMVYPSHYSTGWFGLTVPDAHPYETIFGAMMDTHKKLEEIAEVKPIIRPWIQDFTATWVPGHIRYGVKEIEDQIRALHDAGIEEFLLWNSSNVYTEGVNYDLK
ncbi:hypothetical protein PRECH8_11190 [Insulibacter thermoxylanivorax]|uniref:DUF4015 domain-containing protein n=1 Tax=Insulibacter thermoxylanivorax TaxID=2749268 RepID=A0A916VFF4_9BACL|nr:putative glycoside hydrolase [Insulibacter thermoxylanivorax]GFR37823.1 hypothetical protein PRECH8_11190 [Insulibacter thermoxylanivorax]